MTGVVGAQPGPVTVAVGGDIQDGQEVLDLASRDSDPAVGEALDDGEQFPDDALVVGLGRAADGTRTPQGRQGFRRGCGRPPWPGEDDPAVGSRQPRALRAVQAAVPEDLRGHARDDEIRRISSPSFLLPGARSGRPPDEDPLAPRAAGDPKAGPPAMPNARCSPIVAAGFRRHQRSASGTCPIGGPAR